MALLRWTHVSRRNWIRAFAEALSVSRFSQHVKESIFSDLGQLHSLAGAIAIGPGVLAGDTFIGALSWPLSKVYPFPGRSAGVFIVEELIGFGKDQERWGFNASLIGDAYLNFGFSGVVMVMLLFGALLKILYLKFRQGNLHCCDLHACRAQRCPSVLGFHRGMASSADDSQLRGFRHRVISNAIFRLRHAAI